MMEDVLERASSECLREFAKKVISMFPEMSDELEETLCVIVNGPHFTPFSYKEAVEGMRNEDGTSGSHWGLDEVKDIAKRNDISFSNFNEYDLAYVLNMVRSDYYGAVEDNDAAYLRIALAFLNDKDAPEGKAYLYWKTISQGR